MGFLRKSSISFCTLIGLFVLLHAQPAFAISALDDWDHATRVGLAIHIKIWLAAMMLTNISGLAFLKNHVATRWVFAGFVLSHLTGIVLVMLGSTLLAGQVSMLHVIFWTPGMIALLRYRHEIKLPSAYGIWAMLSLMFYFVSMFFDVPDAIEYIQHVRAAA